MMDRSVSVCLATSPSVESSLEYRATHRFTPQVETRRNPAISVETLVVRADDWATRPESTALEWSTTPGPEGWLLAVRLPVAAGGIALPDFDVDLTAGSGGGL